MMMMHKKTASNCKHSYAGTPSTITTRMDAYALFRRCLVCGRHCLVGRLGWQPKERMMTTPRWDLSGTCPPNTNKNGQKQKYNGTNDLPEILYRRRWSNIGSCLFVVALYAIIALSNREPVTNILYLI